MEKIRSILPEGWETPRGYSQAILAEGRQLFISGQIGWDETSTFQTDDFTEQSAQALRNIVSILVAANTNAKHVTRMTWFITDKQEYLSSLKTLGEKYKEVFGSHFPAMSVIEVKSLLEDRAKVEIEATAVIP